MKKIFEKLANISELEKIVGCGIFMVCISWSAIQLDQHFRVRQSNTPIKQEVKVTLNPNVVPWVTELIKLSETNPEKFTYKVGVSKSDIGDWRYNKTWLYFTKYTVLSCRVINDETIKLNKEETELLYNAFVKWIDHKSKINKANYKLQ